MTKLIEDKALLPRVVVASRSFDRLLAFCGLLVAVLTVAGDHAPALAAFKLIVWLSVPGWAVVRRIPVADPVARLVLTGAISASIAALAGSLMAWSGGWHPQPVAAVILVFSSASICFSPAWGMLHLDFMDWRERDVSRNFPLFVFWIVLGLATVLWGFALTITDTGPLDDFGLLSKFPAIWYVAVSAVLGACIWGIAARHRIPALVMSAAVALLVTMLYASASLLTNVPRLPWTYKHIAVTDLIGAVGRLDPSLDIYNRWPGFFAASAFIGEVIGYPDALGYAAWAELGFALVDVVLVLAIARTISTNPRIYWTAALVFVLANWVGQNYYSPQAFAYTLYLTMCLIALTFLRATPIRLVIGLEGWWTRRRKAAEGEAFPVPGGGVKASATVAILVLQGVISASHQLTPYMAVIGLLPLFGLGFFKPKWVGLALLAIPVLYLLPNWDYVTTTFGLFDGSGMFANATNRTPDQVPSTELGRLQEAGIMMLSACTGVLAAMGYVRRLLNHEVRTTAIVAWLAISPALVLLGQSYGGEGLIRTYLFALPWLAIGVAWFFWSGPFPSRRASLSVASTLSAMALLFTGTYFQPELEHRVSEDEVFAAKWLDARVQRNDLVIEVNSGFPRFPLKIGPNYPLYQTASLAGLLKSSPSVLNTTAIEDYLAVDVDGPANIYVIFSESQERWAVEKERLDPFLLPKAEGELAADDVEKVIDRQTVRVYLLQAKRQVALPVVP